MDVQVKYSYKGIEICGDGKNLGVVECDDGNNNDGDGCSHDCKVEENYKCYRQLNAPDKCKDILPPEAKITVIRGNVIVITFSEIVYPNCTYATGNDFLKITFTSVDKDRMEIEWRISSKLTCNRPLEGMIIETNMKFTIRGIDEMFHIEFASGIFLDIGDNDLKQKKFTTAARRQLYISSSLQTVGIGFLASTYISFIMTIGVNPFKSKPSFWIFVSMIQMLSYIPVLDCNIPLNLDYFLTTYFGISKTSIPFDSLPSWVPNPKDLMAKFKTEPLNSKFENTGYTSISFIYNFGDQLGTWAILVLAYVLIGVIGRAIPRLYSLV